MHDNFEEIFLLLNEEEKHMGEFESLLNRRLLRILMRIYGLSAEFAYASFKGKLSILKKLFLSMFGISQNIHINSNRSFLGEATKLIAQEKQCTYDIRTKLQSISANNDSTARNRTDIFPVIAYAKNKGKKIICIMAPMFTESRLRDGYYRRIKAIDDILGKNSLKIYMSPDCTQEEQRYAPIVKVVDEEHIQLHYLPWIKSNREYANEVADHADIVYHHGVGYMDEDIIRKKHLLKIVDLHGALPEEFAMSKNYPMAQKETLHEELAMRYADFLVSVTDSMVSHMKKKYSGQYSQKYIILPILDKETLASKTKCIEQDKNADVPVIVYAGGMQKWQMVEEMQACMVKQPDYDYRIFTVLPNEFWRLWGDRSFLKHMRVESATPEQLRLEYEECQYGFVLREDCIVNNVACPTKLIEYVLKGIVPIMNTANLGDFVADGLQYVSVENFCRGILPDERTRVQIAENNQKVIDRIIEKYKTGVEELRSIVQGDFE